MTALTGNTDTDEHILSLLHLSDIMALCSSKKYITVCHSKRLRTRYTNAVNSAINYQNKLADSHIIYSSEHFNIFSNLMNKLSISQYNSGAYSLGKQWSVVPQTVNYIEIALYLLDEHDNYLVNYNFIDNHDDFIGYKQYKGDKESIINFLTHIYYDKLYDKIDEPP